MDRFPTEINETISFMSLFASYAYNFYDNPEKKKGIPDHFHIDRELTIDNDNVVMVSDIFKYVIWSIRGTVFTQGNIIDDTNIIVSGKYTNIFKVPYYIDKLRQIILKYKQNRNKKDHYNIYLSSHSLGANKQQYLLFSKESQNRLFIENVDGIFNFALAGSPVASISQTRIFLFPFVNNKGSILHSIGTAVGGLSELDCGRDPILCQIAKGKNFIITVSSDPITYGVRTDAARNELSQIGILVDIPATDEMLSVMELQFEILGVNVLSIQRLKNWVAAHSIDIYNNEYRRSLIPKIKEKYGESRDPEEEVLIFGSGGRFGGEDIITRSETFTFTGKEFTKYVELKRKNAVLGEDPVKDVQRIMKQEEEEKEKELSIINDSTKKIIMTNINIENQLYDMATDRERFEGIMSRNAARSRSIGTLAGGVAAGAGRRDMNDKPLSPIKPVERVRYSPFAVPPVGGGLMGAGAGRQGLPLIPQSYLGIPQLGYGQYSPLEAPHIMDNKKKPEFSKKIHAAPQVKPKDGKLKGRPKPDVEKMKKQMHKEAVKSEMSEQQIKSEYKEKGMIQNSN